MLKARAAAATAAAALTCGLTAAPALGAAASSSDANPQSAAADYNNPVMHITFNAQRAAGAAENQATGTFSADMAIGGLKLMHVAGPVTCLDVVGNHVGLFYPITQSDPTALQKLGAGVFMYAQTGSNGKPQAMSFMVSPLGHASSCTPLSGMIPITSGSLSLSS